MNLLRKVSSRRAAIALTLTSSVILFFAATLSGGSGVLAGEPGNELATCGTTNVQFLGQSEALDKTSFAGFPVRELSGITHDRHGIYYANSDRVSGGDVSRFFTVEIPVGAEPLGTPSVQEVTVLRKADGSQSTGSDFDGEGIALTRQDELFVASEGRAVSDRSQTLQP